MIDEKIIRSRLNTFKWLNKECYKSKKEIIKMLLYDGFEANGCEEYFADAINGKSDWELLRMYLFS